MMKIVVPLLSLAALLPSAIAKTTAPPQKPAAVWSFEELLDSDPNARAVPEPTAGVHDPEAVFPTLAEGVVGNALKPDGLATRLTRPAKLAIDGKYIPRGKDFRFGHNKTLEGTDLIVWAKTRGDKKASFKIQAPTDSGYED